MQLTVKFQSDRRYTVTAQDGLFVACYELLKTRAEARLKSLYIGAASMPMAQAIAQQIRQLFTVKIEIRAAQRCSTAYEVVVRSPKVALMAGIERFISTLISNIKPAAPAFKPIAAKVIPLQPMRVAPLGHRPDLPRREVVRTRDGLLLSIN